jgi:DNA-binding transcriptional LysR family regulator
MIDVRNLQTFIAAAMAGSFAAAARRLSISPAMVGRRIQALEESYGAKLIERTTRKQRLTELGTQFLEQASKVMEDLEGLAEIARPDASGLSGRIRMTGPTTFGIKRLAPLIARLCADHPTLSVELNLSDRSVDLVGEGYDLAIRIGNLKSSSMIARYLGDYTFVCCASADFVERHGAPRKPQDLAAMRCVLNLNIVPRNRWPFLTRQGEVFTVDVEGNVEIDNGEALRMAALQGAGVAYAPFELVKDDLDSGALVEVLAGWRKLTLPINAVYPSRRFVPRRIGAVIEACARELRNP